MCAGAARGRAAVQVCAVGLLAAVRGDGRGGAERAASECHRGEILSARARCCAPWRSHRTGAGLEAAEDARAFADAAGASAAAPGPRRVEMRAGGRAGPWGRPPRPPRAGGRGAKGPNGPNPSRPGLGTSSDEIEALQLALAAGRDRWTQIQHDLDVVLEMQREHARVVLDADAIRGVMTSLVTTQTKLLQGVGQREAQDKGGGAEAAAVPRGPMMELQERFSRVVADERNVLRIGRVLWRFFDAAAADLSEFAARAARDPLRRNALRRPPFSVGTFVERFELRRRAGVAGARSREDARIRRGPGRARAQAAEDARAAAEIRRARGRRRRTPEDSRRPSSGAR